MSDNDAEEIFESKTKTKTKTKKPMTEERKALLLENLKRGRETSLNKRKELASKKKQRVPVETDTTVDKVNSVNVMLPVSTKTVNESNNINADLRELKLMLKEMKYERESERQKNEINDLKNKINELNKTKKSNNDQFDYDKFLLKKPEPKPLLKSTPVTAPVSTPVPVPEKKIIVQNLDHQSLFPNRRSTNLARFA